MQFCAVMSSGNPEVAICPCPIAKVAIVMIMSLSNPDVMSCPWGPMLHAGLAHQQESLGNQLDPPEPTMTGNP